jgi:hypothetical protein
MHNARLEPRVVVDVPAAVLGITSADDDHQARVLDVSETGLFLHTDLPMQVGDILAVRLELDGQMVLVPAAEVMWHRSQATTGPMGAGLRFVALDHNARQTLRSHVLQRLGPPLVVVAPKRHRDLDDTLDLLPQLRASLVEDNLTTEARVFANTTAVPRFVTMLPVAMTTDLVGWSFRALTATEQQGDVHERATVVPTDLQTIAPIVRVAPTITNAEDERQQSRAAARRKELHRRWQGVAVVVAGAACAALSSVALGRWPSSAPTIPVEVAMAPVVAGVEPVSMPAPVVVVPERVVVSEPAIVAEQRVTEPQTVDKPKSTTPTPTPTPTPVAVAPRELHMKVPTGAIISRTFVLHAPERVVIDLTGMEEQPQVPTDLPKAVTGVRVGQPSPGVSRVVLALSEPSTTARASLRQGTLHVRY